MDANGTRYQLVQGWPDWRRFTVNAAGGSINQLCEPAEQNADVVWDCASSSVMLRPEVFRFPTAPGDRPPSLDDRRGAGCDSYGNWYWIAANGREIMVQSSGSGTATHYWSAEDERTRSGGGQHEARYGDFGPAEQPPPVVPLALAGLAVTQDAYLVVGVLKAEDSSGLLVFDLLTGGPPGGRRLPPNGTPYESGTLPPDTLPSPPDWITMPAEFEFAPFDMAPRAGGGVFVLDRDHRRVWLFDRTMNLEAADQLLRTLDDGADDFQPASGPPAPRAPVTIPAGISVDAAVVLGLTDPIAIEGLPDGSFFVLDRNPAATDSLIYHFVKGRADEMPLSTGTMRRNMAGDVGEKLLLGHDIAFAPATSGSGSTTGGAAGTTSNGLVLRGTLAVASGEGNQVFEFDVYERVEAGAGTGADNEVGALTYEPLPAYLPMRLFGGKAIVAMGSEIYYNFDGGAGDPTGERWLLLVKQNRPRFIVGASLFSPAPADSSAEEEQWVFDGKEPDCVWHRLFLDACLPAGASVSVQSRAANDPQALAVAPWQNEPGFYRRPDGSELPYTTLEAGYDTFELLFQAARGQYLQLALTLKGTGQVTPRLRSLRAYYGRFSYLVHYLPAVYRDQADAFGSAAAGGRSDPADRSALTFLDRFMALFEGFLTGIEDKIAAAQALLDPRSAPAEALDWLASWFGVAFDPQWDEVRRRLFIRYAMTFFSQRGTLNGMLMAFQLGFGNCVNDALFTRPLGEQEAKSSIRIVEQFQTRQTPAVVLGDPTEAEGLRVITVDPNARWRPDQGASQLQDRYAAYRQDNDLTAVLPDRFSPVRPAGSPEAGSAWEAFSAETLGFVPAFDDRFAPTQLQLWQDFLARRYGSIETLNNRYALTGVSAASQRFGAFAEIPLPTELPADGAALFDWYAFFSVVPAMHRAAHHFLVLLPAPASGAPGGGDITQAVASQTDLARRILELEKPAHTTFAIRFYWAMFRLGEARLGVDSLIHEGGRSPQFMQPLVLGQTYLAESFLTAMFHDDQARARTR